MKLYFESFLGYTFFSKQEYKHNSLTIPVNTKFTYIGRDNGKFIYQYHLPILAPAGY